MAVSMQIKWCCKRRAFLFMTACVLSVFLIHRFTRQTSVGLPQNPPSIHKYDHHQSRTKQTVVKDYGGVVPQSPVVLESRRERAASVCQRLGRVSGKTSEVTGYRKANLSYCVVQKTGCTIWIRIFKYLEGQNKKSGSPMTITKHGVHYKEMFYYKLLKAQGQDAGFVRSSLRAMTVRNPYTRLWSSYIDKFILPDFWQSKGKEIIKQVRKNPKEKSLRCGHDVTFPEFLQYVVNTGHSFESWNQDKHWLPASDTCDPCIFHPHIIAKQETFLPDVIATLQRAGLATLVNPITAVDPIKFEILDEIDYNFKILPQFSNCLSAQELGQRLWMAFVLNGYLPVESRFPSRVGTFSMNQEMFISLVMNEREKHNITKAYTKLSREHAIRSAYSQVDYGIKRKLRELYKRDFEMFEYELDFDFF